MSKHTPGNWSFYGPAKPTVDAPEGGDYCILSDAGDIIGEAYYRTSPVRTHNALGNARLIAAAPDLLEALRAISDCCDEDRAARDYLSRQTEIRGIARAAIAKAEGR